MSGVAYCECGHTGDDHPAGGACIHRNAGRKFAAPAPCGCGRLAVDPRLVSSDEFIAKVLNKVLAKEQIPMEPVEREDALQVLAIALWKTAQKYDSRSHVRFRVYAYLELYNDAIDHFRSERGRNGQHRVYDPRAGLADVDSAAGVGDGAARADRLDGAASRDPADDSDGWAADGGGLLKGGDGGPSRLAGEPGDARGRGDAGSDPRPVQPTHRRPRAEDPDARDQPESSVRGAA